MAINVYLSGTTGAADGTLDVQGDGIGLSLTALNAVAVAHLRCPTGDVNADGIVITAPTDCHASTDGSTYGATASYAAGEVGDTNTPIYIKRVTDSGNTEPLALFVAITGLANSVLAPAAPVLGTVTVSDVTSTTATVMFSATDANGDALTYKVAVTTSATPPADWSGYSDTTSPYSATGLTAETAHYAHVRVTDGTLYDVETSAQFTTSAGGDTTAPAIAGTLTATPTATQGQVTLAGPTATDNVAIAKWQYQVNGDAWVDVASTSGTFPSTTVSGLAVGSHSFAVRAVDTSGNPSITKTAIAPIFLTYDFTGAADSAPPAVFTVQTAGNGTAALDGSGNLKLYSAATTDGATAGLTDPIPKETHTYKRKFRATAPTASVYSDALQVSGRSTRPPIGPGADSLAFNDFYIGCNWNSLGTPNSTALISYKTSDGTQYWWNPTTPGWQTTEVNVPTLLNTDYVAILETTATQARLTLKNSTETTTLIQCPWLDWSVIRNNTSNLWLWWGDISNTSRYATTLDDSFSVA